MWSGGKSEALYLLLNVLIMKRTLLIFIILVSLVLSGTIVNAQSRREQRRAERAERKQVEAEQREKTRKRMLSLVDKQSFVLTANILYDKRQNSYPESGLLQC